MGIYLFDQLIYCSALNMGVYLYVKSVEWYAFIRLCRPLLNWKLENKQGFGVETSINWESRACLSSWGEMGPAHVHSCHPTSGACTTTSLCKRGLTMSQLRNRIRWHGTMDVRFGGRVWPGTVLSLPLPMRFLRVWPPLWPVRSGPSSDPAHRTIPQFTPPAIGPGQRRFLFFWLIYHR